MTAFKVCLLLRLPFSKGQIHRSFDRVYTSDGITLILSYSPLQSHGLRLASISCWSLTSQPSEASISLTQDGLSGQVCYLMLTCLIKPMRVSSDK